MPRICLLKKAPFPTLPFSSTTLLSNHRQSPLMELPDYLTGGYYGAAATQFSSENPKSVEHFAVDEYLLDFSTEDAPMTSGFFDNVAGSSSDSSTVTAIESCDSSVSGGDNHFSGSRSFSEAQFSSELCIPYEDLADLEWLSNFVEDSFATVEEKNLHALPFLSAVRTSHTSETSSSSLISRRSDCAENVSLFRNEAVAVPLPGKARSKRSRASPCDWSTRFLHAPAHAPTRESSNSEPSSGRKCLHCATEKTPQWRTGPMGPKTLCNACGVRFKSGRLVPEYRPASSPSFVSTKHSNSHRKVLELRRQKEVHRAQQQQHQFLGQSSIFRTSNGYGDCLIDHHNGRDFSHMI